MSARTYGLLLAVSTLLLVVAWLSKELALWSVIGNYMLPWFCAALALALLIVLLVCALRGESPAELPWQVVAGTVLATAIVLTVGAEVDAETYGLPDLIGTRWEIGGFLTLLTGVFLVGRR